MNKTKILFYLCIPLLMSCILTGMYFSGNIVLQRLVSPVLPPMSPDAWREFGLLENVANIMILILFALACYAVRIKKHLLERAGFSVLALLFLFVFVEEIDYGTHFYKYATSDNEYNWFMPKTEWSQELIQSIDLDTKPFNLHNKGDAIDTVKKFVDVGMVLFFVVFPFIGSRFKNKWIRYATPDRFVILTILVIVVMRFVVHELGDWDEGLVRAAISSGGPINRELGSISNNLSEFRELNTYYLVAVYLGNLVLNKKLDQDD